MGRKYHRRVGGHGSSPINKLARGEVSIYRPDASGNLVLVETREVTMHPNFAVAHPLKIQRFLDKQRQRQTAKDEARGHLAGCEAC
jgi:hypothetical protein